IARRCGDKKGITAVGHSILVIAWHVLRNGEPYRALGHEYFDRLDRDPLVRYHTRRLAELGVVPPPPSPPAAASWRVAFGGSLLDHFIRARKHRWWDGEAKGLRSLEVHDQLELRGAPRREDRPAWRPSGSCPRTRQRDGSSPIHSVRRSSIPGP